MNYNEIKLEQWQEIQPFIDTVVIPVVQLKPWDEPTAISDKIKRLKTAEGWLERFFTGRILIMPEIVAVHGWQPFDFKNAEKSFAEAGYKYVLFIQLNEDSRLNRGQQNLSCIDVPSFDEMKESSFAEKINQVVLSLWNKDGALESWNKS